MNWNAKNIVILAVLAAVGIGGVWYGVEEGERRRNLVLSADFEGRMPAFSFPDMHGRTRHSREWADQVLVLNFWATWCPPCRKEIPLFVDFQERYGEAGLQFVGIAIDDPEMVRDFADVYGMNFPILIGDAAAVELSKQLGNRFESLPFTAVFDRQGRAVHVQAGPIEEPELKALVTPLLQSGGA